MIIEYHRPETIDQALELLARPKPRTLPLGGGSVLNAPSEDEYAVVDLQRLNLHKIAKKGNSLQIGATTTLQTLLDNPHIPAALGEAIQHETAYNLRQVATVAGALVSADGRSPMAAALLSLDAKLTLMPNEEKIALGDLLPLRSERMPKRLITQIAIPLQAKLIYQYVARSPADLPVVCVALAQWPSGRTRIVLGGYGNVPVLAMDGGNTAGALDAVKNAYDQAEDQWASADYRQDVAETLTQRSLALLSDEN